MSDLMLWYDNDPKTDLEAKVRRAADYFERKYGVRPTVCHIHPVVAAQEVCGVKVVLDSLVLKGHLLIGVGEDE